MAEDQGAPALPLQQQPVGGGAARDARVMEAASPLFRSLLRAPALLGTFGIELVVAFVFSRYQNTFKQYPLLISFQPVISAISGNVGLQASSTNVRALSLGFVSEDAILGGMRRELIAGLISGAAMALICGVTAGIWYSPLFQTDDGHTWYGAFIFALAISFGMFVSIISAAITGAVGAVAAAAAPTAERHSSGRGEPTSFPGCCGGYHLARNVRLDSEELGRPCGRLSGGQH